MCSLRTSEVHKYLLEQVKSDPSSAAIYGVECESVFSSLSTYRIDTFFPPDVMHDVLEGVVPLIIPTVLNGLLEAQILTLKNLDKVQSFEYGRHDKKNKPSCISRDCLKGKAPLRGTVSQKWCLLRLLPQLFADKISEGNEVWELYLVLREIVDIVTDPKILRSSVAYLQLLVQFLFITGKHFLQMRDPQQRRIFLFTITAFCSCMASFLSFGALGMRLRTSTSRFFLRGCTITETLLRLSYSGTS